MELLPQLAGLSLRACLLAGLAAGSIWVFRLRTASAQHAIWTVVMVGMLFQVLVAGLLPPLPLRLLRAPASDGPAVRPATIPPLPLAAGVAKKQTYWPGSRDEAALALYCVGVLYLGIRFLAGYIFLRRVVRQATPVITDLACGFPVRESHAISVPMTAGWRRTLILLPQGWRDWDSAKLRAVLAHEEAHIRRRDWLFALVARVNRCVFWFHPLSWWLERQLSNLAERSCDDAALVLVGNRRKYAETLIEIVRDAQSSGGRFLTGATAMAKNASVLNRLDSILDESRPLPGPLSRGFRWTLGISGVAAICLVSAVRLATAQTPPTAIEVTPYTKWINEDVTYIATDDERNAFQRLATNEEREMFIVQFWLRRDSTPGTQENEYKKEHYRRIAYANERFRTFTAKPGWQTDRGRIYIVFGPPDEIESHPSGGPHGVTPALGEQPGQPQVTSPFEVWRYRTPDLYFGFVDQDRTGDYRSVSGVDTPFGIVNQREPKYTDAALAARIEGTVGLRLTVTAGGAAENIRVVQSLDPGLDQNAIECLRSWVWRPATHNGRPIASDVNFFLSFKLPR